MLINGIELSSLGVHLYDRVLNSNQVETSQEWLDGDIQPTVIRQQDKFRNIKLSFLVLGQDEEDAFMRISKLTHMLKRATINFDDLNLTFKVSLVGQANTNRLKNGNFIVDYDLTSDYAFGDRDIYTTDASMTNSFKLTILYYQNSTKLLSSETLTIYASSFNEDPSKNTFESLGISINKYQPQYYNQGTVVNMNGLDLTYDNLQRLQTLIINYTPVSYNITVNYFMNNGTGYYETIVEEKVSFTYPSIENATTIGQVINIKKYQPDGYSSKTDYEGEITVDALLKASPINVYYDKIENEQTKNVALQFQKETDSGTYEIIDSYLLLVKESDFYDGFTLGDLINVNSFKPEKYYNDGYIEGHSLSELITYETTETAYTIKYPKTENTIYVEYYAGIYPNWYRLSTISVTTKYMDKYETSFSLEDLDIDLDKYQTSEYLPGAIYNTDSFDSYDDVINAGVIQVYYKPIEYPIVVKYFKDGELESFKEENITLDATDFFGAPILSDIININQNRPEGYQFSPELSYSGEVSLAELTKASPITITYEVIEASRTKNVLVKYKKELSSAYSTITTILITVNESDCVGGVRLENIINLNAYRPDYYDAGILDGASSTALVDFDSIASNYDVIYTATYYLTPVRYYIDEVLELNWVGSASLKYRVIDFTASTTLYDLGLDVNAYKPSYCDNGIVQYTGPVNFTALRELSSVDVVYPKVKDPEDPDETQYPHKFLFLQHNDLGDYENLHPEWTMNHAYINTGISAEDMSRLTVVMECGRVDDNVPLHNVNEGYAYLFGSSSPFGSFFMRFNNQTQYGTNLTGVNTYEAKAGYYSDTLVLTEEAAVGFGPNTGIYASDRAGYSYATFTYTHNLACEKVAMPYPLYLFANNNAGSYADGLGGIGIYSCRIYYDNQLVRDMIPVEYYDKIGDKVAPSNCLYDKVTETFFEDGTGMNSFNIIDDERYPNTNPDFQIGKCYVKYYQDEGLFKTVIVYFRASDFIDKEYDPYEAFDVEGFQPPYTNVGYIKDFDNLVFDFDNMNNNTYTVVYESLDTQITVNYYTEVDGVRRLIQTDNIPISEKDFYQSPTFGDIVRLNKYKPEGFKTDFKYEGNKVSLSRVLALSPYSIVYVPETEPLEEYTTTVKYIKKVFGIREYEEVGTTVLKFDQTDFRDGEYIDFYIDKNLYKPKKYYMDGTTYQWYEMDERLDTPDKLKPEYIIMYPTSEEYVDVNYYTDEWDEANLIASTTWKIKLDDFNGEFQLADQLPNEYINKYKPTICAGGVLQNSSVWYTFESLLEAGEIAIVYETIEEPNDPESAKYEQKVLYFGHIDDSMGIAFDSLESDVRKGPACIPFIDLGYRPKEIGRLRVELTGDAQASGFEANTTQWGMQSLDWTYWFGYWGPTSLAAIGTTFDAANAGRLIAHKLAGGETQELLTDISPGSKGCFGVRCHVPKADNWSYNAQGPQSLDGVGWHYASADIGEFRTPSKRYHGIYGYFRRGLFSYCDDDFNEFYGYKNYGISRKNHKQGMLASDLGTDGYTQLILDLQSVVGAHPGGFWSQQLNEGKNYCFANPFTIIMDAYNNYMSVYDVATSNNPQSMLIENGDVDIFENREQPKGTLSLFRTTNPTTGDVNIQPITFYTYPKVSGFPLALAQTAQKNPYQNSDLGNYGSIVEEVLQVTGKDEFGNPIYETVKTTRNVLYCDFPIPVNPSIRGAAIWRIKIYDRDRLVRDMIPVAKGDQIYDYVMPANGLFDLVTEIFFGNTNQGGTYEGYDYVYDSENGDLTQQVEWRVKVEPPTEDLMVYSTDPSPRVLPLFTVPDLISYGKITTNYYNEDNEFINNQFVNVPTWFYRYNTTIEDLLAFNDFKPDEFHLDGFLDLDADITFEELRLRDIYEMGSVNVLYKLRTYTKTVVFYQDNVRIGSKDIFYSLDDIMNAKTIADLGIDVNLYQDENFKPGRVVFNESIIAEDDIKAFIDAPSPIVVYDKYTKEEKPNLLYLEYYRGGAYDDDLITINPEDSNYLDCQLTGKVLNPNGAIKYYNHYHDALYEDEKFEYFIPYQVKVLNHYTGIHYGPAKRYKTLAMIVKEDVLTIIEERNGWGRLKEYPTGWIILSATEPMTGPGQNPDYDTPEDQVATIPFAEEVEITKLTIDRLWCYVPAQESWIKAEDISYSQAGKLYNGLKIQVIDLDTLDFSSISSLEDMGIYPEKYRLRFHDYCNYTYSGEYTKEAFSAIHELDFVYPETIYNYTCVYYKDNKADENELGRAGFSCSISDWTPDWDIFISTSWQTDDDGNPINPTLYRDTEITLTWDYFGFERNLYKPDGYPDGIYLWNPRSWQNKEIYFSFNELITTGSQYVIYPTFDPNLYKMCIPYGIWSPYTDQNPTPVWRGFYYVNLPDFTGVQLFGEEYEKYDLEVPIPNEMWWDIEYAQEYITKSVSDKFSSTSYGGLDLSTQTRNGLDSYIDRPFYFNGYGKTQKSPGVYYLAYYVRPSGGLGSYFDAVYSEQHSGLKDPHIPEVAGEGIVLNYSTKRKGATTVASFYNDILGKESEFYIACKPDFVQILPNTNLSEYRTAPANIDVVKKYGTSEYYVPNVELMIKNKGRSGLPIDDLGFRFQAGIHKYFKLYKNFNLIHYLVAVPKGLHYIWNGEKKQMPANGWFDIIDGIFYPLAVTQAKAYTPEIYKKNQDPNTEEPTYYFEGLTFDSTECNYIVQINTTGIGYDYPDELSLEEGPMTKGLVLPVSKFTADAAHDIIGEWYYSSGRWFKTSLASMYAGDFDASRLKEDYKTITLVNNDSKTITFYTHLNPEGVNPDDVSEYSYGRDPVVLTSYYTYTTAAGDNFFFDGSFWIPEANTDYNRNEVNKAYAVIRNVDYYSVPIAREEYKVGTLLYGERTSILYTIGNNPDWGYTGKGWVRIANNLDEVV